VRACWASGFAAEVFISHGDVTVCLPRDLSEALPHLRLNLDLRGSLALLGEPLVEDHIGQGKPLEGLERQHAHHQRLEGVAEVAHWVVCLVQRPKSCVVSLADQLVVLVSLGGLLEREGPSHHDEDDDRHCEQVDNLALERHLEVDLWGHVAWCANESVSFKAGGLCAVNEICQPEVGKLEVVLVIEEHVLRLQVSVRNSLAVGVVNRLDQLLGVVAHDLGLKLASLLYHVK